MSLIIFQLFTNITIGSYVFFDDKILKVVDFHITTLFSKGLLRPTWKKPLHFTLVCINEYGGIETVGSGAVKSIYDSGLTYTQISKVISKL